MLKENYPGLFSKFTSYPIVDYILKLGSCQPGWEELPGKQFPRNKNNRHFYPGYYFKRLEDLTSLKRDWLSYSPSEDKIFCLHCMLFAQNGEKAWTENRFNNCTKLSQSLILHETPSKHAEATIKAKIKEVRHLIDTTLYLALHCMAFRGHRDSLKENLQGNFLDIVRLLSDYSPVMNVYMDSLRTKKENNFLINRRRQNELIHCVAKFVRNNILQELKEAPFFSVCMDTTFDKSRKEQLCFVVRYSDGKSGKVLERLLFVNKCTFTTGAQLFEKFEKICEEFNLDWKKNLVYQS